MLGFIVEKPCFLFYTLLKRVPWTYCLLSQDFSECYIERRGFSSNIFRPKSKRVPEKHLFCFIDYAKAFDCVDHNKLENS